MPRLIASAMMALTGVCFFAAFVSQDIAIHPEIPFADLPWPMILRYAFAMTLGGALSGFLLWRLFGRTGVGGWLRALCGGIVTVALSGLVGSAFGLLPDLLVDGLNATEVIQVLMGIFIVPLAVIEQPYLLAVLLILIALTHMLSKRSRI